MVPISNGTASLLGCVVHHVAFDGWSEAVLAGDLAAAYNALRAGKPYADPSPPTLRQLHKECTGGVAADRDAATRSMIESLRSIGPITWPVGPTNPSAAPPGRIETMLGRPAVAEIAALAAKLGVTRFVVLLTSWAAALSQITGQRDLAIGVPVRQRNAAIMDGVIGCHINMICVRLRGGVLESGTSAIADTARCVQHAMAMQDVPCAELLGAVRTPFGDRPPLFQTLFALQDNPPPLLPLAGARTTFLRQPYLELPLELHAELWPDHAGGLRFELFFREDVVPERVARELARGFLANVEAAAAACV
jgi:hypothetical protein